MGCKRRPADSRVTPAAMFLELGAIPLPAKEWKGCRARSTIASAWRAPPAIHRRPGHGLQRTYTGPKGFAELLDIRLVPLSLSPAGMSSAAFDAEAGPAVGESAAGERGAPAVTLAWQAIRRDFRAGLRWTILGAVSGVVATPVLVALTTLVFRFPVPFGGYVSGPGSVGPAVAAGVLFYGVYFGGLAVQAALGAVAGFAGARFGKPDEKRMRRLCILAAVLTAECGIFVLAVLDWIIGPW